MRQIGVYSEKIISLLSLNIEAGTPIFIGSNNERHIKERHPVEYELYLPRIEEIIADPDYVRNNKKAHSVDFVKVFQFGSDYVQVSVRVDAHGNHFVRTLFQMMSYKIERYIESGGLIKVP